MERLGLTTIAPRASEFLAGAHLDYKRWHMTQATATSLANGSRRQYIEFSSARKRQLGPGIDYHAAAAIEERPGPALGRLGHRLERRAEGDSDYGPGSKTLRRRRAGRVAVSRVQLPTGSNSFFRQLDFVVATVADAVRKIVP